MAAPIALRRSEATPRGAAASRTRFGEVESTQTGKALQSVDSRHATRFFQPITIRGPAAATGEHGSTGGPLLPAASACGPSCPPAAVQRAPPTPLRGLTRGSARESGRGWQRRSRRRVTMTLLLLILLIASPPSSRRSDSRSLRRPNFRTVPSLSRKTKEKAKFDLLC